MKAACLLARILLQTAVYQRPDFCGQYAGTTFAAVITGSDGQQLSHGFFRIIAGARLLILFYYLVYRPTAARTLSGYTALLRPDTVYIWIIFCRSTILFIFDLCFFVGKGQGLLFEWTTFQ